MMSGDEVRSVVDISEARDLEHIQAEDENDLELSADALILLKKKREMALLRHVRGYAVENLEKLVGDSPIFSD